MIVLLGLGYIGTAFAQVMTDRKYSYVAVTRNMVDYTDPKTFSDILRNIRPRLVINCAAFVPGGAVDNCEDHKSETIRGNLCLPMMLSECCQECDVPLLHVSTGCLYNGDNGGRGWSEKDPPQLSYATKCGVYVGAKELAERYLSQYPKAYICRIRLPFDHFDHKRNFLSKLQYYPKVVLAENSISHRFDFAQACLDLNSQYAPYGTYNVTNPGSVSSDWICDRINDVFQTQRKFEFWDPEEFTLTVARTPKSNCKLDTSKLLSTGVKMRPVEEAVIDSLKKWIANPTVTA